MSGECIKLATPSLHTRNRRLDLREDTCGAAGRNLLFFSPIVWAADPNDLVYVLSTRWLIPDDVVS